MFQRVYPLSWLECLTSHYNDIGDNRGMPFGPPNNPTVRVTPVGRPAPACPFLVVAHGVPVVVFYPNETVQYVGPKCPPAGSLDYVEPFFLPWLASVRTLGGWCNRNGCIHTISSRLRYFYELPGYVFANSRGLSPESTDIELPELDTVVDCPMCPVINPDTNEWIARYIPHGLSDPFIDATISTTVASERWSILIHSSSSGASIIRRTIIESAQ